MLIEKETVEAYHMKARAMTAVISGYMQAFVEYGIRHKTLGDDFKAAGNGGSEVIRRAVESNRERICDSRFLSA